MHKKAGIAEKKSKNLEKSFYLFVHVLFQFWRMCFAHIGNS